MLILTSHGGLFDSLLSNLNSVTVSFLPDHLADDVLPVGIDIILTDENNNGI